MKWHKKPYLPVVDPLADSIPRAFLYAGHQRAVVDYAVEDLSSRRRGYSHMWRSAVLRNRTRSAAGAAHLPG